MDMKDQLDHLPKHTDHALFIDTNLTWLDAEWWEALLAEPGRVHVTARVVLELVPFLQRNQGHQLRNALKSPHPAIVLHPDIEDDAWSRCFDYYVNLLAYRRRLLDSSIRRFEAHTDGRKPSADELNELEDEATSCVW
jgi:hypothetical protein